MPTAGQSGERSWSLGNHLGRLSVKGLPLDIYYPPLIRPRGDGKRIGQITPDYYVDDLQLFAGEASKFGAKMIGITETQLNC
jgi:hypothetical protein